MKTTAIIGAGIVGICSAIALADRGQNVTLVDRSAPGSETSRWNAGVLATSSLIPLNNPGIFSKLPRMMAGRYPGFRLNPRAGIAVLPWAWRFLANARASPCERAIAALDGLIKHSRTSHENLCARASTNCLQTNGWIMAYRGATGHMRALQTGRALTVRGVSAQVLSLDDLHTLEPSLRPVFTGAVHVLDSAHVTPMALLEAYIELAHDLGIRILCEDVNKISPLSQGIAVHGKDGQVGTFDQVVLAAGAWTNQLLRQIDRPLPMMVERGYLQRFSATPENNPTRPFLDVDGGYVASPRACSVQISTGTELTQVHVPPDTRQFSKALANARDALQLGAPQQADIAVGNRPTLPDSLPAIGPVQRVPGLWLATGHQHIGFSTSAGTGDMLAALMTDAQPQIDPRPFSPSRFAL